MYFYFPCLLIDGSKGSVTRAETLSIQEKSHSVIPETKTNSDLATMMEERIQEMKVEFDLILVEEREKHKEEMLAMEMKSFEFHSSFFPNGFII